MSTEEYADVLPTGWLDDTMSRQQAQQAIRSGAVPATLVWERVRERLTIIAGMALIAGIVVLHFTTAVL